MSIFVESKFYYKGIKKMDNQNNTTPEYNGPQKICKHCKKAIPKVSKTCPYCFQKQGMKTSTIVIIVIVVIALAAIFGNLGSSDTTDEKNDTPVSNPVDNIQNEQQDNQQGEPQNVVEDTKKEEPAFDYEFSDVVDLIQEYKDNEVAADEKYKGKTVKVTGLVKDIGKDIFDSSYITINDGKDITWDYAQCYFKNKDEIAKVSNLQKGDTVTLIGKVGSYSLSLTINKCVFVEEAE